MTTCWICAAAQDNDTPQAVHKPVPADELPEAPAAIEAPDDDGRGWPDEDAPEEEPPAEEPKGTTPEEPAEELAGAAPLSFCSNLQQRAVRFSPQY